MGLCAEGSSLAMGSTLSRRDHPNEVRVFGKRFEIDVVDGKEAVLIALVDGSFEIVQCILTFTSECRYSGERVEDVIGLGQQL